MDRIGTNEVEQICAIWLLRVLDAEIKALREAIYAIRRTKLMNESVRYVRWNLLR